MRAFCVCESVCVSVSECACVGVGVAAAAAAAAAVVAGAPVLIPGPTAAVAGLKPRKRKRAAARRPPRVASAAIARTALVVAASQPLRKRRERPVHHRTAPRFGRVHVHHEHIASILRRQVPCQPLAVEVLQLGRHQRRRRAIGTTRRRPLPHGCEPLKPQRLERLVRLALRGPCIAAAHRLEHQVVRVGRDAGRKVVRR